MIKDLFEQQKPLMVAGLVSLICGALALVLSAVDDTQILGISRWIKPMKFFFSIAIFIGTIAVLLHNLKGRERFSRFTSWAMILVFVVEMAAVVMQALRGTTSHFNVGSPLDAVIFAIMGVAIVFNTVLVLVLTYHYFRSDIDLINSMIWSIRLGLLIFLAGSIQGGYMSTQLGHAVGVADGGPGLPITNWSTVAGDLRVAHFLGLHSIQVIPMFALLGERLINSRVTLLVVGFAAGYLALFVFLFVQALRGIPVLAI